jgi:hypothetical protein
MKVRYIGPFVDGVEVVPSGFAGQDAPRVHVAQGEEYETTEEHAAALLEQEGNWEAVTPPAKPKTKEGDAA